jgi:hypothetical protein
MAIQVLTKLIELLQSIRNCITKKKPTTKRKMTLLEEDFINPNDPMLITPQSKSRGNL